jgi:hypothetical protein
VEALGSIRIFQRGRAGRIEVPVDGTVLPFEWEFGGGRAVAIVYVPTPEQWGAGDPWRRFNRDELLTAIAQEVCRLKCKGCTFSIDATAITLYEP